MSALSNISGSVKLHDTRGPDVPVKKKGKNKKITGVSYLLFSWTEVTFSKAAVDYYYMRLFSDLFQRPYCFWLSANGSYRMSLSLSKNCKPTRQVSWLVLKVEIKCLLCALAHEFIFYKPLELVVMPLWWCSMLQEQYCIVHGVRARRI